MEDATYLYTGAESAPLKSQAQALERYLQERSRAEAGRAEHIETEKRCKQRVSDLMGCAADDIGLVGSASEAIVLIASGIDFKPGDNIVTNDLEFPQHRVALAADERTRCRGAIGAQPELAAYAG